MKAVIQRVSKASVTIDGSIHSQIGNGLLVLLGIEDADTIEDIEWLSSKIVNLRIFNDENRRDECISERYQRRYLIGQPIYPACFY